MVQNSTLQFFINAYKRENTKIKKREVQAPSQYSLDLIMQYAKSYEVYDSNNIGNIELIGN